MVKSTDNNKNLRKYFETYVEKLRISADFKPIIVDILLRRSQEFELSKEDIMQDMTSLLYNLDFIKVRRFPKEYRKALGLYLPKYKTILLSRDYVLEGDKESLYETLTHEVYHALSYDENGNDRLSSINKFTNEPNISLLEAIIEKAADRCVYPMDRTHKPYIKENKNGYPDITFITDAIEAVYGVTEKDFLKNGIMGRKRLANFLAEKVGETPEKTLSFLDEIEVNYNMLYNTLYPLDNSKLSKNVMRDNLVSAISGVYRSCEFKMAQIIENKDIHGVRQARAFTKEVNFNHNKLRYIMEYSMKFFEKHKHINISDEIKADVHPFERATLVKINDLNSILQYDLNAIPHKEMIRLLGVAKRGALIREEFDNLYKAGIILIRNNVFSEDKECVKRHLEEDFTYDSWDNSKIGLMTKKACEKNGNIRLLEKIKHKYKQKKKETERKKTRNKSPKIKKGYHTSGKYEENNSREFVFPKESTFSLAKEDLEKFNIETANISTTHSDLNEKLNRNSETRKDIEEK